MDRVKGHDNDENNKRADRSAVQGALSANRIKGSETGVRKQFFKDAKRFKSREGSYVPHQGLKVYIHIYTFRPLKNGRGFRYNYEIISPDSEYFMYKGWLFYPTGGLSAEYIYLVKFADDGSHYVLEIIEKLSKEEMRNIIIEQIGDQDIFYGKNK